MRAFRETENAIKSRLEEVDEQIAYLRKHYILNDFPES
jgi:hypothetical protein